MLDAVQQRILGVLFEKEATVPDSYPLTENTLLLGCNQKNNRDPEMGLALDEMLGALDRLRLEGWVTRIEQLGSRTIRWRHQFESQLGVDRDEAAVLTELLLRGSQAPGALKPRVARFGFATTPAEILDLLRGLAARDAPLVRQLPRRPRERDQRWTHLLGPTVEPEEAAPEEATAAAPATVDVPAPPGVEDRVAELEREVVELRREIAELRARLDG